MTVNMDDQETQNFNFSSGDTKTFIAKQKIILSTSDAGATDISLNGQNLGLMGKAKEQLSGITFYAPPASATTTPVK